MLVTEQFFFTLFISFHYFSFEGFTVEMKRIEIKKIERDLFLNQTVSFFSLAVAPTNFLFTCVWFEGKKAVKLQVGI